MTMRRALRRDEDTGEVYLVYVNENDDLLEEPYGPFTRKEIERRFPWVTHNQILKLFPPLN